MHQGLLALVSSVILGVWSFIVLNGFCYFQCMFWSGEIFIVLNGVCYFQSCLECGEDYCAGCFAAFHLRGNLKKHRSVPLGVSNCLQLVLSTAKNLV